MHRDNLGTMYHVRELTSKYQREISSVAPAAVQCAWCTWTTLLYAGRESLLSCLSLCHLGCLSDLSGGSCLAGPRNGPAGTVGQLVIFPCIGLYLFKVPNLS